MMEIDLFQNHLKKASFAVVNKVQKILIKNIKY